MPHVATTSAKTHPNAAERKTGVDKLFMEEHEDLSLLSSKEDPLSGSTKILGESWIVLTTE